MRNVTDLMNKYRECSRHLWNTYIRAEKTNFQIESAYENVKKVLFEVIVRLPAGMKSEALLFVVPMPSLPVLIRRPSADGNYYWDQEPDLRAGDNDIDLAFIDYYDFFQEPVKDFRFYRCTILKFPRYPRYEGREALVDIAHADVFLREE